MRTFHVGDSQVTSLIYTLDSRQLVCDVRGPSRTHPWYPNLPVGQCHELSWWDWSSGVVNRRFRLRDSLYGENGVLLDTEDAVDRTPNETALDVSVASNGIVATVWEWTNKEEGVAGYNVPMTEGVYLSVPYKTHIHRIALAPNGSSIAAATVHDMDGSSLLEVWKFGRLSPEEIEAHQSAEGGWGRVADDRAAEMDRACLNPFQDLATLIFNGKFLAASGLDSDRVVVWNPGDPRSIDREENPSISVGFSSGCLALTPNSSWLAVGGKGLCLIDPVSLQRVSLLRTGPRISAVAFSPDGMTLGTGRVDGATEFWSLAQQPTLRATIQLPLSTVTTLTFSPDGLTCAAGGESGRVVVWDIDL